WRARQTSRRKTRTFAAAEGGASRLQAAVFQRSNVSDFPGDEYRNRRARTARFSAVLRVYSGDVDSLCEAFHGQYDAVESGHSTFHAGNAGRTRVAPAAYKLSNRHRPAASENKRARR